MYLSRFGVKNYKCLGEIEIPLTPIHVLIGQNDCGKTSLLEAMAAFFATSEKLVSDVFPEPWSGRELVCHNSSQPKIDFVGEWKCLDTQDVTSPGLIYGLSLNFGITGRSCNAAEQWIVTAGEKRLLWPADSMLPETSVKRWRDGNQLPAPVSVDDVKTVASILRPAHKYALDAKLMAVPASIDPARKFRLDPDGFGLATLLDDILGFDPKIFLDVRKEFCERFPQFRSVRVESENAAYRQYQSHGMHSSGTAIGKGIYFETKAGETVRARHASDGAALFLGLLALARVPQPPNLLLIEEPENGIYPKRLGEVIELLKQMVHRTEGVPFPQIILSTHSPYVLSFFEPEEVTFLSRAPGPADTPVRGRPLRDAPNIRERLGNDFYLGELWYNLSEGELFGEAQ